MSNVFSAIINESIRAIHNNDIANFNSNLYNYNRDEHMLAQIAKEKIGEYFEDGRVIQNGDIDLTEYKNIFDYDPALQKRLYDLQKERELSILSGQFLSATRASEKSNQIKQFEDLGRAITAQNDGAKVKDQIVNHYANGDDSNPQKHAELMKDLAKYASTERSQNTKYMLWMSDYEDVCSSCKTNNYKLFSINEEVFRHPNCRCKQLYFDSYPGTAKRYLIVIFSGIGMEQNDGSMWGLGELLKQKLLDRNNENTVEIEQIAPYANDKGQMGDAILVFKHANFTTEEVNRFTNQVITKYNSGKYDSVIFIGYSGGGVMASRVAENINYRIPVNKIIRIGSPELFVNKNDYANITYDMSLANDPITRVLFTRENIENVKIYDEILTGYIIGNKWNPFNLHTSYFTQDRDKYGIRNLEKTVDAILRQVE